ncbi:MAG: hypothetical protein V4726_15465 [Verrucomicrobiota bacterium]
MTDLIVQEIREIRASIAKDFGYDRARYLDWARKETRRNTSSPLTLPEVIPPCEDKVLAETASQP